ncbi:uncharacterized protein LOC103926683 [Pyrus x bretschneideri]|uniref:uncharacterized protein LOC103926683 n=1 Tax=Pyrus x bretschneideri TaxID=225117 RepID=UPI0020301ADB|nr:uncharacterized protein LOC103926683 [Pyrus x bretschneideri]
MSRARDESGGWAAFDLKQRQKKGLEPQVYKDPFLTIPNTLTSLHPRVNVPRNNDLPGRPFSTLLLPSVDCSTSAENSVGKRPLLDGDSSGKQYTSVEDNTSSMKKIMDLYPWADDFLIEDIMVAMDNDMDKASILLKQWFPPAAVERITKLAFQKNNSSSNVSLSDREYVPQSPSGISNRNSTIQNCLKENKIELLTGDDYGVQKLAIDAANRKLVLGSLESVPIEPEWEEDDVYLKHRKDALRMMRSASQHSKAATHAFARGDHFSAQQHSKKAREERLAAESLNKKAAKEILRIKNSKNDLWKLDLHGLHASEAIQALHEHLQQIETKELANRSVSPNRVKMEKMIIRSSSHESFSCTDRKKLDQQKASSTQRSASLEIITGRGNHSRGQAALPTAVRSFLNENGYRFEELRPGVITVRPKFRHR